MENGSAPDGITTTGRRFHDHGHGMTLGGSALRPLWALCELINAKHGAAHYVYPNRPCYNIP